MRKVIYTCDLCRLDFVHPEEDLIGFEFQSRSGKFGNTEELVVKSNPQVNRHWCKKCWQMVKEMVNR